MEDKFKEYHFYKGLGICVRCHKNEAEPNKVMCLECIDKESEYKKNKRSQKLNEQRTNDLNKYYKLKEQGICTYCKHEKAEIGKTKCKKCLAIIRNRRNAKKNDIERSERISYGLCYICGKNKLMKDKGVCEHCYNILYKNISKAMYMHSNNYWDNDNKLICKKN